MDLTVRRLQTKDFFRVAKIVKNSSGEARQILMRAAATFNAAREDKSAPIQFATLDFLLAFLEAAVGQDREIRELLADLAGMKPDEFDATPFDTPLEILEKVAEQDDLPGFLAKAQGLAKKISG